ncbi:class I SAM-dependent DNA methyltransferase [Desulfuribacillus stibiiarsenatis]|nr:class I SAM-dependent methyltransferase [Desulfuribacillus stibiiarsenatis]
MEAYREFADTYDYLMRDAPYQQWLELIEKIIHERSKSTEGKTNGQMKIADLGCGTGTLSILLAEKGFEIWGIDISEDMLAIAQEKLGKLSLPVQRRVRFLQQDMVELKLPVSFDVVFAFCDSLNYVVDEGELSQAFANINNALAPNGFFIFDMLSIKKMQSLGARKHFEVSDDTICIWQNEWDLDNELLTYDVTILTQEYGQMQMYKRVDEYHQQRGYQPELILSLLERNGFELHHTFADFHYDTPLNEAQDRYFWVVRKR